MWRDFETIRANDSTRASGTIRDGYIPLDWRLILNSPISLGRSLINPFWARDGARWHVWTGASNLDFAKSLRNRIDFAWNRNVEWINYDIDLDFSSIRLKSLLGLSEIAIISFSHDILGFKRSFQENSNENHLTNDQNRGVNVKNPRGGWCRLKFSSRTSSSPNFLHYGCERAGRGGGGGKISTTALARHLSGCTLAGRSERGRDIPNKFFQRRLTTERRKPWIREGGGRKKWN